MRTLRLLVPLMLLFCGRAVTTRAQEVQTPSLNLGDVAPPLRVGAWLKGTPIERFEKGMVYVVEFWATWCRPCIAATPHLSALAAKYNGEITFIGMDVYEAKVKPRKSLPQVKAFVDSMGQRMDFAIAAEDSNFMVAGWLEATGETDNGIPRTFVVNGDGRLAWIGYPTDVDSVLPKILNHTWNINEALADRNEEKHLEVLDSIANSQLNRYLGPADKGDLGNPDSALLLINKLVQSEPKLEYAPLISFHTFTALLKTDQHKAYLYGKGAMQDTSNRAPQYGFIIGVIDWYSDKLKLPPEIYELGAEAYQGKINLLHESHYLFIYYDKMAQWYRRANEKAKSIESEQKAIELVKTNKELSGKNLAAYQSRLQRYKNM